MSTGLQSPFDRDIWPNNRGVCVIARNGSGSYAKVNTYTAGNTITASGHNQNWDDIATEMTNSVAADGQTTITGALKGANGTVSLPSYAFASDLDCGLYRIGANNLGVAVNGAKVLDISTTGLTVTGAFSPTTVFSAPDGTVSLPAYAFSNDLDCGIYRIGANNLGVAVNGAKVLDIGTAGLGVTGTLTPTSNLTLKDGGDTASATTLTLPAGNIHNITGTTATTSIAAKGIGTIIYLRANAAWPITHHATNLICTTGASITAAAGDWMAFEEYGAGTWRMLWYQRATGRALSAPAGYWQLISTQTPSAVATVGVTGFNASLYSDYRIVFDQLLPATDNVNLYIRTSTDGGSNYDAGAGAYRYGGDGVAGASATNITSASATEISMTFTNTVGNAAGEGGSGEILIINPGAAARCRLFWRYFGLSPAGAVLSTQGSGDRNSAGDVDAVQMLFESGDIASGTVRFYGLTI